MVAADHHRRLQLALRHHLVEGKSQPMPVAEADPANARRQALKRDAIPRHVEPAMEMIVARRQFLHLRIGLVDVLRIARKRRPAERPDAAAEQRPDIGRHEAGKREGVLEPFFLRHLADVVAVVERRHAIIPERHHRLDMFAHRRPRRRLDRLRIALALRLPFGQRPALRQIAVERIMRRGLVGHHVRLDSAPDELGQDFGCIAQKPDRLRLARLRPARDHVERLVEARRLLVDVTGALAKIDPRLVALDGKAARPRHHRRQRLRTAHAAEPCRKYPLTFKVAAIMLPARLHERLVRALHDTLRADIDPRPGRHLAVHHEPLLIELVEMAPVRPVRDEIGIGDQHPRRILVRAEHAHRLARLHEQRLLLGQALEARDDPVEIGPSPRCAPDPAIDDEFVRVLRYVGVEIVHQHPHRRLGRPLLRSDLGSARRTDFADVVAWIGHEIPPMAASSSAASNVASVRRSGSALSASKVQGSSSAAR